MHPSFLRIFRRGAQPALPVFLLACLGVCPLPALAEVSSPAPAQTARSAPVPPGMQRIYVFDSMESSLTPMLCRPEDPAVPAAAEGRLGVKTRTATPTQASGPAPVAQMSPSVNPAGIAPVPAYSPVPGATGPMPTGNRASFALTPLDQEIRTIWKYYARRDQAYLPRGEGPLWGPSPDPAARKRVPEFSRTYLRTSTPGVVRPTAPKAPAAPGGAPQSAGLTGMQAAPAVPPVATSITVTNTQEIEELSPPVARAPSALAPAAGSGSLAPPPPSIMTSPPAPSIATARSLGR